jgi:hypothetical protein
MSYFQYGAGVESLVEHLSGAEFGKRVIIVALNHVDLGPKEP